MSHRSPDGRDGADTDSTMALLDHAAAARARHDNDDDDNINNDDDDDARTTMGGDREMHAMSSQSPLDVRIGALEAAIEQGQGQAAAVHSPPLPDAPWPSPIAATAPPLAHKPPRDYSHWLYILVLGAAVCGVIVGLAAPSFAVRLKPLGTGFVELIKMLITPVIFCTIVLGIGSVRKASTGGKVAALSLSYFLVMSTLALTVGLVVGNVLQPGKGMKYESTGVPPVVPPKKSLTEFVLGIIPKTLVSALTEGQVLQALFVALLFGFALQTMGADGLPILTAVGYAQKVVFKILSMIMWVAPVGAFGAMAAVVGATGTSALLGLLKIMLGFYITCAFFIFVILGTLLKLCTGVNIFRLLKYLGREILLIVSTSSSETALPRLIGKMEHMGISRSCVGITVPTGYSFNLDGTAIYLTMASLFVSQAMDLPMSIGEQISLLLFMIVASKGAAGVTGAGLATLAAGLASHQPALLDGVGLIVGIDRFMSEARAVTNFIGNAVACVLIGHWLRERDVAKGNRVLSGEEPFDEVAFAAGGHGH